LETIEIYTDGSSLGNPGPGGYGIVLKHKGKRKTASQGFRKTTNNRMELLAVIEALKLLNDAARTMEVHLYSDSKYVLDAISKGWVFNWVKKGFKGKKNEDLWRRFLNIYPRFTIKLHWVKGHSGVPENEVCDKLAKEAAESKNLKIDHGYEKGTDAQTSLL
jgi:ribonuclease HI